LAEPSPDTYEGDLQSRTRGWALVRSATGRTRTDITPQMGYFPLDKSTLDGSDALLHIN
jgi:hypothetical protein